MYIKYPRTLHLPFSPGVASDDKMLSHEQVKKLYHGKNITITEKMDGECFPAFTPILMADGTKKDIKNIKVGDFVLGLNLNQEVTATKVLNVFRNGKTDKWLKIYFSSPFKKSLKYIICTESHELYSDGVYVKAKDIKPKDNFSHYTSSSDLSQMVQEDVPEIMQHKLPKKYRGLKVEPNTRHSSNVVSQLQSVSVSHVQILTDFEYSEKYDIETETHNYFANGILVHNCTTLYSDYIHARSLDSASHSSRDWVKRFQSEIGHNIPDFWRICGENLFAKHSISYDNLDSYFYGFSIWDETNTCLSVSETKLWFDLLGIQHVPIVTQFINYGNWYDAIRDHAEIIVEKGGEGIVIRNDNNFHYNEFKNNVAKYVRKDHIQTDQHWMQTQIIPNKLKKHEL